MPAGFMRADQVDRVACFGPTTGHRRCQRPAGERPPSPRATSTSCVSAPLRLYPPSSRSLSDSVILASPLQRFAPSYLPTLCSPHCRSHAPGARRSCFPESGPFRGPSPEGPRPSSQVINASFSLSCLRCAGRRLLVLVRQYMLAAAVLASKLWCRNCR